MQRILCPHCGLRDSDEFSPAGDASVTRPDTDATVDSFVNYVYLRANRAGRHEEWWHHHFGCRSWLRVVRDTTTHEVLAVTWPHEPRGDRV